MAKTRGVFCIILNVLWIIGIAALEGIKEMTKSGIIRAVAGTKSARQLAALNQKQRPWDRTRHLSEETPEQREIREWNEAVQSKKDSK